VTAVLYLVTAEIKKIVVLLLESFHNVLVLLGDLLDAFNAKVLDALRLVDELHQLDDLLQTFGERVELAKDVVLAVTDTSHAGRILNAAKGKLHSLWTAIMRARLVVVS